MSKPESNATINHVITELICAGSSLCMEPDPVSHDDQEGTYLVHIDKWARHSHSHIRAAVESARGVDKQLGTLSDIKYKLSKAIRSCDNGEVKEELKDIRNLLNNITA